MIAWLLIPLGVVMIVKADKIVSFTGEIPFAEKVFGSGGTYTFVKVLGLLMSIFAFMWVFGGLDSFLQATLGKFIPGSQ